MKGSILVVDDEPNIRVVFESFLTNAGYTVTTAINYDTAIQALKKQKFDLIYTDIHLGDKNGLDLLRTIRDHKIDAIVLLVTGYPNLETVQQALRFGAYDYLTKPVLKETLLRLTASAMNHKNLVDEKERFRQNMAAIFRSVKDAIVTVNKDLEIQEANEAAENLLGLKRNRSNRAFAEVVKLKSQCLEAFQSVLTQVVKHRKTVEIPQLSCPSKEHQRFLQVTASPLISETGHFLGALLVIRDETRITILEKDLQERGQFHRIIGRSPAMQRIYQLIEDLASVETTVLISGESGTGKELIADALHYQGGRKKDPLVKINCAALTDNLLESELFGHIRGAFTGAIKDKVGRFELAHKGTIFLDEIGDISSHMQTRLLRVLQEKTIEKVGDTKTVTIDVRVVAATNQNLRTRVQEKKFREDLFYRLKVVEIILPPLRDRREDIPLLVNHFIKRFNQKFAKNIKSCTARVMKVFMEYGWPGNIRELEHVIEHAFVVCHKAAIDVEDLPPELRSSQLLTPALHTQNLPQEDERESILRVLRSTGWVKAKAARLLGFSRSTMYRKLKEYHIDIEEPALEPQNHERKK
ncbi:sigma 54-interacting transcriptional regulator [Magnetococcales bacterium HHB-1]